MGVSLSLHLVSACQPGSDLILCVVPASHRPHGAGLVLASAPAFSYGCCCYLRVLRCNVLAHREKLAVQGLH